MASSTTTSSSPSAAPASAANAKYKKIGYIVQLSGIAGFTLGAVLSIHHIAIGAAFLGGVAAFYVGQKIRTVA